MKSYFTIGVSVSIAFVLGAIVWLFFYANRPEPAWEGKPLHVWLKGFDAAQESAEYSAAQAAVRQIGTNALPILINYLHRKDPPYHRQWVNLKAKLHLLHGEVDYAVFWHRRAAHACGALGEAAAPAFPALTEAMNDPGAASDVGNGLSRIMPNSVPVLTNILAAGNVTARCRAADNLVTAFSHPTVEPMARTALLNALHDPDPGPRTEAASALQFWNTRLDVIIPALTAALGDPYPGVRGNAATSLGNFGGSAKAAVPELLKLLQDTNRYVSGTVGDRAAMMLLKIDPQPTYFGGAGDTNTHWVGYQVSVQPDTLKWTAYTLDPSKRGHIKPAPASFRFVATNIWSANFDETVFRGNTQILGVAKHTIRIITQDPQSMQIQDGEVTFGLLRLSEDDMAVLRSGRIPGLQGNADRQTIRSGTQKSSAMTDSRGLP